MNLIEELRALGWSQEGARRYAELLKDHSLYMSDSQTEMLFIVLGILLAAIVIIAFLESVLSETKKETESGEVKVGNLIESDKIKEEKVELEATQELSSPSVDLIPMKEQSESDVAVRDEMQFPRPTSRGLKEISVDTDKVIRHIIFISIFFFELLVKAWNTFFPSSDDLAKDVIKTLEISPIKKELSTKTDSELRQFLQGMHVIDSFNREQMINLILSNPKAIRKLSFENRKSILMSKKNNELRTLLSGVEKISSLKKSELVEKVLYIEYGNEDSL